MTEPESQPMLTRQLAAECDMLRMRSAAHERTEAEMRRKLDRLTKQLAIFRDDLRKSIAIGEDLREQVKQYKQSLEYNRVTIENLKATGGVLSEQVAGYKESLRLIQQLRRAEG